ncbi:MAG: 4-(cytidine 5'-diphospho)-2-C-methyl-D-erythritol kinase [Bacteroidota bacterium]|nr:4-(cytidine 5'-diphospho)-2-C-methyl-D-erythritol kinase [Bacteroidota bacterium]
MITFPNCKINIGLNIVGKRADGYHDIETVFFPLSLSDALEILPAEEGQTEDRFVEEGTKLQDDAEQNLCMKALRLMQKQVRLTPVKIVLLKKIPVGAGLGGGSADATFTLKMLNSMHNAGFTDRQLTDMVATLGSDCSFFMINKPVFACGKGDQMSPVSMDLKGLTIVVVKPPIFVSTAEAYSGTTPARPEKSLKELVQLPFSQWRDVICNDFEKTIFALHPGIAAIKSRLYEMGALYASMSGSGSSVFGLFDKTVNASSLFPDCFYHEETSLF